MVMDKAQLHQIFSDIKQQLAGDFYFGDDSLSKTVLMGTYHPFAKEGVFSNPSIAVVVKVMPFKKGISRVKALFIIIRIGNILGHPAM